MEISQSEIEWMIFSIYFFLIIDIVFCFRNLYKKKFINKMIKIQ